MRPFHILLAVRIIILYQLFLLFCVHRGLLFFLVLLFAISETPPTRFVLFPLVPLHISRVLVSFLVLLVVLRVHVSCYSIFPLSVSLSVYSPLRSDPSASSALADGAFGTNSSFFSPYPILLAGISPPRCLFHSLIRSWVLARTGGAFPHFLSPT